MSCPCKFEPSMPIGCVMELVGIVRSGELLAAKAEVLKHAGCILGSLGAYIDQDTSPDVFASAGFDLPCTIEEAAQECEAALGSTEGASIAAINPALVALLIRFATLLLDHYLK